MPTSQATKRRTLWRRKGPTPAPPRAPAPAPVLLPAPATLLTITAANHAQSPTPQPRRQPDAANATAPLAEVTVFSPLESISRSALHSPRPIVHRTPRRHHAHTEPPSPIPLYQSAALSFRPRRAPPMCPPFRNWTSTALMTATTHVSPPTRSLESSTTPHLDQPPLSVSL